MKRIGIVEVLNEELAKRKLRKEAEAEAGNLGSGMDNSNSNGLNEYSNSNAFMMGNGNDLMNTQRDKDKDDNSTSAKKEETKSFFKTNSNIEEKRKSDISNVKDTLTLQKAMSMSTKNVEKKYTIETARNDLSLLLLNV